MADVVTGGDRLPLPPVSVEEFAARMAPLGPFGPAPRLAAGVSGGPHSLALALLAADWAQARCGSLLALVADHGLRPESAAEAADVAAMLTARGIACRVLPLLGLVPGMARMQERARAARLAALLRACREAGAPWLLLGHHRADQAETLLFRALRGSGAAGLAAMPPARPAAEALVLRPLLDLPPARLEAVAVAAGLRPVRDPTNEDRRFARPRLRAALADPGGTGAATAALAEAAAAFAVRRQVLEATIADRLAVAVEIRPEGFAWLDPERLAAEPATLGIGREWPDARRAVLGAGPEWPDARRAVLGPDPERRAAPLAALGPGSEQPAAAPAVPGADPVGRASGPISSGIDPGEPAAGPEAGRTGWERLANDPVAVGALAALLRLLGGGAAFAPGAEAVRALLRRAVAGQGGTLAGVRVRVGPPQGNRKRRWLLLREAGAALGPAVRCAPGAVWDGRFRLLGEGRPGCTVAALGPVAAADRGLRRDAARRGIPAVVLATLPCIRDPHGALAALPALAYPDARAEGRFGVAFAPVGGPPAVWVA